MTRPSALCSQQYCGQAGRCELAAVCGPPAAAPKVLTAFYAVLISLPGINHTILDCIIAGTSGC
jgi:hypothetical protein